MGWEGRESPLPLPLPPHRDKENHIKIHDLHNKIQITDTENRIQNTETHILKITNVPVFYLALGLNDFDGGKSITRPIKIITSRAI